MKKDKIQCIDKIMKYILEIVSLITKRSAPILTGGLAVYIFNKALEDLNRDIYKLSLLFSVATVTLLASMYLFYKLRKIEKEKDVIVLKVIESISQSVFSHYGSKLAEQNAEMAKPNEMNKIMQSIVNLTNKLVTVWNKNYKAEN